MRETSSQSHVWMHLGALALGRWAQGLVDPLRQAEHNPDHHRGRGGEGGHRKGEGWGHGIAMGTPSSWLPAMRSGQRVLQLQCRLSIPSKAKDLRCGPVTSRQQWPKKAVCMESELLSANTALHRSEQHRKWAKTNQNQQGSNHHSPLPQANLM